MIIVHIEIHLHSKTYWYVVQAQDSEKAKELVQLDHNDNHPEDRFVQTYMMTIVYAAPLNIEGETEEKILNRQATK